MKIENVKVFGVEESIKAAKFPMSIDSSKCDSKLTNGIKNLARVPIGTGHDNWLNGCIVQFDLTAPVKMWTEAQRYHFLDFVSSQSTIHRITKFDLDEQYNKYVDKDIIEIMKKKVKNYNHWAELKDPTSACINITKEELNDRLKEMYLEILYSNPCGFELTARMTTNYRQLKTIYCQRKNHILPEWHTFCDWVLTLPYMKEFLEGVD